MYHKEAMLVARTAAIRLLPLLVLVWATLVMAGGVVHMVKQADLEADSAAKTGLGLCTISVAVMSGAGIRKATSQLWSRRLLPEPALQRPPRSPRFHRRPPPAPPPGLELLKISRT